ncbi:hypothetical protein DC522_12600 [Microvirga sp. KLBC 81]|uniref:sensor histidine kinase n=1 Tax=Microvirga sp. KLBC 81 TaxID=1862707 RepID=UPI000D5197C0|nr:sensor histidine kinase [Microvirga sp. KLBC 81]PVE24123.1 hypothetical protein DC522_12600 [Microvirga sp. KLBC 81]
MDRASVDVPRANENGNLTFIQTYDFDLSNPDDAFIFEEFQDRIAGRLFQIPGLGLKLLDAFTTQLDGQIEQEPVKKGTRTCVKFPLPL